MTSQCQSCGTATLGGAYAGLCPACMLVSALDGDADDRVPEAPACGWFGDYELVEEIGRGGMGVVYRARQPALHREVALKVILAGPYAEVEARHRFRVEAETAAALQHPGIVAIHEVGDCEGRPYLTMSLHPGGNLSQRCDGRPVPARRAAELVRAIARAVQHAHERGVLHRDLKPSNILLDADDCPVVTDFGLAKRVADPTDATLTGLVLGSPNYVSPEQAAGRSAQVGPGADIHALGGLLYYLLTGRPPFLAATLPETLRLVLETDPVPPRLLAPGIPRDLETVCLKCLEKDPLRRYGTAAELGADLGRFLADEPVRARAPGRYYRLAKFVRRNRVVVSAAAVIAVALVAGTVVSSVQATRARRAERAAEIARARAIAEQTRAEDLLTFMLGDLRGQLAKVGRLDVLESVGDKALDYFRSQATHEQSDATLARHARALTQIGEIRMEQARYTEAAAAFAEGFERAAALAARHPQDGGMLFERAQAEFWSGFVHWKRGELGEADAWLTRYHESCVALVQLDPARADWRNELSSSLHNLATLQLDRREFAAARAGFRAELAALREMPPAQRDSADGRYRMAQTHSWLGGVADQVGDYAETSREYAAAVEQFEALLRQEPATPRWQHQLAEMRLHQADLAMATGQLPLAREHLRQARELVDRLVAFDPANRRWLAAALNARFKEALLLRHAGDAGASRQLLADLRPQLDQLSAAAPADRKFVLWRARAWRLEAQLLAATAPAEAAVAAARAVELGASLIREGRATDGDVGEWARAKVVAGEIALTAGDPEIARQHWQQAEATLAPRLPESRDRWLLDPAARAAARLGRTDEATAIITQLTLLGYVPLEPWAEGEARALASSSVSQP